MKLIIFAREAEYLQAAMPAAQTPHGLGLHARHAQEILRVRQVGGQLRELRVKMGLQDQISGQTLPGC